MGGLKNLGLVCGLVGPNLKKKINQKSITFIIKRPVLLSESAYIVVSYKRNIFPVDNYLFKANKRNTRPKCEICSKFTIKTPEQCE